MMRLMLSLWCPPLVASPPPWSVEDIDAAYVVKDNNGQWRQLF